MARRPCILGAETVYQVCRGNCVCRERTQVWAKENVSTQRTAMAGNRSLLWKVMGQKYNYFPANNPPKSLSQNTFHHVRAILSKVDGKRNDALAADLLGFTETVIPRRWRVAGLGGAAV